MSSVQLECSKSEQCLVGVLKENILCYNHCMHIIIHVLVSNIWFGSCSNKTETKGLSLNLLCPKLYVGIICMSLKPHTETYRYVGMNVGCLTCRQAGSQARSSQLLGYDK